MTDQQMIELTIDEVGAKGDGIAELEGEKVYVFFMKHRSLQQFLSIIRRSNPNITFKNLSPTMHQIT